MALFSVGVTFTSHPTTNISVTSRAAIFIPTFGRTSYMTVDKQHIILYVSLAIALLAGTYLVADKRAESARTEAAVAKSHRFDWRMKKKR
jgi:hypothetical protein